MNYYPGFHGKYYCLVFCLFLFSASAFSQSKKISISQINNRKISDKEIIMSAGLTFKGIFFSSGNKIGDLNIQIAWRKEDTEGWLIQAPALLNLNKKGKTYDWELAGLYMDRAYGLKNTIEFIAIATLDSPLPEGVVDNELIIYAAEAVSSPISVDLIEQEIVEEEVFPRIRIERIGEEIISSDTTIYEVKLEEELRGMVRKPDNAQIQLIVQPLNGTDRWIMEMDPLATDNTWKGTAYFGRRGLDEWNSFSVYAIISKSRISIGTRISPTLWQKLIQTNILAISQEIGVIRIEKPGKPNIKIDITNIDRQKVLSDSMISCSQKSGITGTLGGRTIGTDEQIWIFTTPLHGKDEWRNVGKAFLSNDRNWELPPHILGKVGKYISVKAVVSDEKFLSLDNADIKKRTAFSESIAIYLKDSPPIEINIRAVDQIRISSWEEEMLVPWLSSIEGAVAGNDLQQEDKVWILKMPNALESDDWIVIGEGKRINTNTWKLMPSKIGRPGEKIILIAVVSKTMIGDFNSHEKSQILAYSNKLHIRLK